MKKRDRRSAYVTPGARLISALEARSTRRNWMVERLEERHMMTATPLNNPTIVWQSLDSNDTEDLPAILNREIDRIVDRAADLGQYSVESLEASKSWVVRLNPEVSAEQFASSTGLDVLSAYGELSRSYVVSTAGEELEDVLKEFRANELIDTYFPVVPIQSKTNALPNDPLLPAQWHLINSGQFVSQPDSPTYLQVVGTPGEDLNVSGAWALGYTGKGVTVGVVDSGFDVSHPDLVGNLLTNLGFDFAGNDSNVRPNAPSEGHGTAVAGLIGAVGNNGIGTTGVAYEADLVPIRLIPGQFDLDSTNVTDLAISSALRYLNQVIDVYNNSWGPGTPRVASGPGPLTEIALRDGVRFGRGGLGSIYVFSAGNDAGPGFSPGFNDVGALSSGQYNGFANSRYTIAVGAIDEGGNYRNPETGTVTNYSEAGSHLLVVAPSGTNALAIGRDGAPDSANLNTTGSGIWTTDIRGDDGYNSAPLANGFEFDRDFLADTNYTSTFGGTSTSAPLVSGTIALMLEANPNLSWRDVQEILLRSARQNDQFDPSWINNPYHWYVVPEGEPMGADLFENNENGPAAPVQRPFLPNGDPQQLLFENAAGYTISQGYGNYGEDYGYGHGVVDAKLAVQLAEQWTPLAPETTLTTYVTGGNIRIQPRITTSQDNGDLIIPGGISQVDQNTAYWDEFYADMPWDGDPPPVIPIRHGGNFIPIVMDVNPQLMSVEWIEFKVDVTSGDMDHLRMTIVSPDGTMSELNPFRAVLGDGTKEVQFSRDPTVQTAGNPGVYAELTDGVPAGTGWTFSTNRHWGEVFNPLAGDWNLALENWGAGAVVFGNVEVIFHGQRISGERVLGKVGIDDGKQGAGNENDQTFNFDRFIETPALDDMGMPVIDPVTMLPIMLRSFDLTQESFGSNVTVVAKRASDGQEFKFVTGADGNFYFDLPDGTYNISTVDPLGRAAIVGTNAHGGTATEVSYTIVVDSSDDIERTENVNFLLKPGGLAPKNVTVSGVVYADNNGDGIANGEDLALANINVYLDLNFSGAYDAGDQIVQTADDPATPAVDFKYSFTINSTAPKQVQVGVVRPTDWTFASPASGVIKNFIELGGSATANFFIKPPANGSGGGGGGGGSVNTPGIVLGRVFSDLNGNGIRELSEAGVSGIQVYIDANQNGAFDAGEKSTNSQASGAYSFTDVAPGTYVVRAIVAAPFVQTAPSSGEGRIVVLGSGGTANNVLFGVQNQATRDFGDLGAVAGVPGSYPTTLAQNGAWHTIISGIYLGNTVDGELNGQPSADATGDNVIGADEDGVTLLGDGIITPGETQLVRVAVSGVGGKLNAWIDFNRDGDWDDTGEKVFNDVDLNPGTHNLSFAVPATSSTAGPLPSRFRWGSAGLTYTGGAIAGEVEDYLFATTVTAIPTSGVLAGDYDRNGFVNNVDYNVWRDAFGQIGANLPADGNGNGIVDLADYSIWRDNKGSSAASAAASTASVAAVSSVVSATGIDYSGLRGWSLASGNVVTVEAAATTNLPLSAGSLADEALLQLLADDAVSDADDVEDDFCLYGDESADEEALVLALESPILLAF